MNLIDFFRKSGKDQENDIIEGIGETLPRKSLAHRLNITTHLDKKLLLFLFMTNTEVMKYCYISNLSLCEDDNHRIVTVIDAKIRMNLYLYRNCQKCTDNC